MTCLISGVDLADLLLKLIEVNGRQQLAGATGDRLLALEYDTLEIDGEAAGGLTHHALEVTDAGVERLALFDDVLRGEVVLHHEYRKVADHL